jgi:arylsulfatase A-like enzyme/Tfp pilus assembly protein PilF
MAPIHARFSPGLTIPAAGALVAAAGLAITLGAACRGNEQTRDATTRAALGTLPRGLAPEDLSLVLVTLDTTRADRIGTALTPRINALAAGGTRFTRATSVTPLTLPAHSTILTGLLPPAHGVRDNGGFRLAPERVTLAEVLQARGFATGGFVSAYVLDRKWGIAQGFDRYYDDFDLAKKKTANMGEIQRRGDDTLAHALDWLTAIPAERRAFLWLHLYDPHTPYEPPEPFASAHRGRPYDGEIAWTDDLIGKLVDGLRGAGRADRTVIALLGDHGESLGEHGEHDHGYFIYEATTHVPMVLAGPWSGLRGKTIDAPVGQADIAPTLLDLLGIEDGVRSNPRQPGAEDRAAATRLEAGQGRSVVSLLAPPAPPRPERAAGAPHAPERPSYSESFLPRFHYGWSELRSLRTDRWSFIEAPKPELYDLSKDPRETENLVDQERRTLRELRDALAALEAAIPPPATSSAPVEEDEETMRALAALGYIGGQEIDTSKSFRDLPDPKDRLGVYAKISRARGLAQSADPEKAVPLLQEILAEAPEVVDAWFTLGNVHYKRHRWDDAARCYRETLERRPDHDWAMIGLADTYVAKGQIDEAVAGYRRHLQSDPANAQIQYRLGQVLLDAGRDAEAATALRATLAAEPATARAEVGLAVVAFRARDFAAAHAALDRALAISREAKWAHYNRALVLEAEGKLREALAEYRAELAIAPESPRVLFNYGRGLDTAGDPAGALDAYRRAVAADDGFHAARFFLARALLGAGDLAGAEREARTALAGEPEHAVSPLGHYVLADVWNRRGRPDDAAREVRAGKELEGRLARKGPPPARSSALGG